ncbi:MAG TPA: ABC transporter permease [Gammaproteobacteria bacterium]|nr:ABC transporter permease [Gammaproteobacteria bacterium]
MINPFRGLGAIFYKEVIHARRDRMAIMFSFIMPILQMTILGAAIDTNVRQVPTVVLDESGASQTATPSDRGTFDSRALLDRLRNSDTFRIIKYVRSDRELNEEMIAGRARVGIKIPVNFARDLLDGRSAQVMVMVDGSDSSVAGQAVNVSSQIGLDESLRRLLPAGVAVPIEVRPKLMFNPDSRSPNFFLPGLTAVLLLFVTTMLTAFSIVREKERGTLEQLLVTPARPLGILLGKIMPYFALGVLELSAILIFMRYVFQVPIHGNALLLIVLSTGYLFVNLTIGTLISTKANSQAEAMQLAMMTTLPSIFLSGYIFPRDTMPLVFYGMSYFVPATYMVDISRGVILRGAGVAELWIDAVALAFLGLLVLLMAVRRFTRMIV